MRTIKVCPGIGDNIWLLMKLVNAGERFIFQLSDGKPQRGKQIFDLFPQVAAGAEYVPGLPYKVIKENNIANFLPKFSSINIQDFYLSCNEHLEAGHRIEEFLPDLPTTYKLDYVTTNDQHQIASDFLTPGLKNKKRHIGIFGSSYSTTRAWGFWNEDGWFELISKIHKYDPGYKFVIIGADWDTDMARNLMSKLEGANIPFVNTVGQDLGTVVEILKHIDYFIGFPSGLSILNETLGKNGVMFYPPHLSKMINAWADPARIQSGDYKGCLFCSPDKIFDWLIQNNRI